MTDEQRRRLADWLWEHIEYDVSESPKSYQRERYTDDIIDEVYDGDAGLRWNDEW